MAEHPIIMTAESIRAIFDGRKTQTRRVPSRTSVVVDGYRAKPEIWKRLAWENARAAGDRAFMVLRKKRGTGVLTMNLCVRPVIRPGDTLWVREAFAPTYGELVQCGVAYRSTMSLIGYPSEPGYGALYRRGCVHDVEIAKPHSQWRSPLYMPKWACRLRLAVSDVRFERLQYISEPDAFAEGVQIPVGSDGTGYLVECSSRYPVSDYLVPGFTGWDPPAAKAHLARAYFASGWDHLNAKRGFSWKDNPVVLVYTFGVLEAKRGKDVEGTHA